MRLLESISFTGLFYENEIQFSTYDIKFYETETEFMNIKIIFIKVKFNIILEKIDFIIPKFNFISYKWNLREWKSKLHFRNPIFYKVISIAHKLKWISLKWIRFLHELDLWLLKSIKHISFNYMHTEFYEMKKHITDILFHCYVYVCINSFSFFSLIIWWFINCITNTHIYLIIYLI